MKLHINLHENTFIFLIRGRWPHKIERDSSPKNEKSVINYSPSCRSKPIRPSLIFGTQIEIFEMKSESLLTFHRQQHNYHIQDPES